MTRSRAQAGGFTLVEVLVALLVTVVGLAGVMMMQAETVRNNRRTSQFTRASNIAEEVMEGLRGVSVKKILAGVEVDPQTYNDVTYTVAVSTASTPASAQLVVVTVTVSYDEDGDATESSDDRSISMQMLRTTKEAL